MPVNNPPRAQDYNNAHDDLQTVEDVVNGPVGGTVTSRLGRSIQTLAGAIASIVDGSAFLTKLFGIRKASTYAELTAISASNRFHGMVVNVTSRASDGDGGHGHWRFDAASTATANGGTILAPDAGTGRWFRVFSGAVYPEWFGALGNAVHSTTGVATATDATFTDANASWTSADIGKSITLKGAGATPSLRHTTTIASINSPTSIELTDAVVTTVASNCEYVYGTDDNTAIQSALDYVASVGGGIVQFLAKHYFNASLLEVGDNTTIQGVVGGTVIWIPNNSCFRTVDPAGGNTNIVIRDMSFNANGTGGGAVAMDCVTNVWCDRLDVKNINLRGVTVGIGFSRKEAAPCGGITITNCNIDATDYGIVIDSTNARGPIEDFVIADNIIDTDWGSAISIAGDVKQGVINANTLNLVGVGTPYGASGVPVADDTGIGVKIWYGTSTTVCPDDISVVGNTITGQSTYVDMTGATINNYANNIIVSNNVFRHLNYMVKNDFSNTADTLSVVGNVGKNCDYLVFNVTSSDYGTIVSGNQVTDCNYGISGTFHHASITGNKFKNIANEAIRLANPCKFTAITGNSFTEIGKQVLVIPADNANSRNIAFSSNVVENACTSADNAYDLLDLNNQSHSIVGNVIVTGAGNQPTYIIGGDGNFRLIANNWLFGAVTGYRRTTGANDVYANNIERGL